MATYKYFIWPFLFTAVGLALGAWIGFVYSGTVEGTLSVLFICAVLGILEISLSFDNAIVNARILRDMTPVWQRRFLTWGIIIAVFGMRIIFPLAIVAIAAWIDPISALKLAISNPEQYARIMQDAHVGISAFGGTFLLMVGLKFFFDHEKDVHWIRVVESRASRFASVQGIEVGVNDLNSVSTGRPCTLSNWTCCTGQPMAAAAREKEDGAGRMRISLRSTKRVSVAPMPKCMGSPLASTTTWVPCNAVRLG